MLSLNAQASENVRSNNNKPKPSSSSSSTRKVLGASKATSPYSGTAFTFKTPEQRRTRGGSSREAKENAARAAAAALANSPVADLINEVKRLTPGSTSSSPGGVDELALLQAALDRSNRNLELCHQALRTVLEDRDKIRDTMEQQIVDVQRVAMEREASLTVQIEAIREQLQESQEENASLRERVKLGSEALEKRNRELETARRQASMESQHEMASLRGELQASQEEAASLRTRLQMNAELLEERNKQLRAANQKCAAEGREEVAQLRADLQQSSEEKAVLRSRLQLATQTALALRDEAGKLRSELTDIRKVVKEMPKGFAEALTQVQGTVHQVLDEMQQDQGSVAALEAELADVRAQLEAEQKQREHSEHKLGEMEQLRRKLHNKVQQLRGNIRVMCRVRPLRSDEEQQRMLEVVHPESRSGLISVINNTSGRQNTFEFEKVFAPSDSQDEVFEEVRDLVVSVMDGYNVCIFAYGQTGSGKTYTMEGAEGNRGINHRALRRLFETIEERERECDVSVTVNMLEIYNEQVYDLLQRSSRSDLSSPMKQTFDVRRGEYGMYAKGASSVAVESYDEVANVIAQGLATRAMAATNVHERSSRSHCVLTVRVVSTHRVTGSQYQGKLHLIDLAGSENVARSEASGMRLREAQHINKSLSALGDVFLALSKKSRHVPYRNSKLTHLLSDSLGGNSKTLMMVCLNPTEECVSETLCSLNFASRARTIRIGAATPHKRPRRVDASPAGFLSPS